MQLIMVLIGYSVLDLNIYASIGIGYFALMEILQFFQYKVINQCNNDYNKFLTNLGYIHICFQPVFVNLWLFAFTNKPNFIFLNKIIKKVVIFFCFAKNIMPSLTFN